MDVEHWLARALDYSLMSGRSRAVALATGSRRAERVAAAFRAMSNGFLEVGFAQIAAASRGDELATATHRTAQGGAAGEE